MLCIPGFVSDVMFHRYRTSKCDANRASTHCDLDVASGAAPNHGRPLVTTVILVNQEDIPSCKLQA